MNKIQEVMEYSKKGSYVKVNSFAYKMLDMDYETLQEQLKLFTMEAVPKEQKKLLKAVIEEIEKLQERDDRAIIIDIPGRVKTQYWLGLEDIKQLLEDSIK